MVGDQLNDRDSVTYRQPFFWLFLIFAVALVVILIPNFRDDSTNASFISTGENPRLVTSAPIVSTLPTPQPSPIREAVATTVELSYQIDAIVISGTASAPAVVDALLGVAGALVGSDAVTSSVSILDTGTPTGTVLVLSGEVADEMERLAVISAFSDLGLFIDDRLILAGSGQTVGDVVRDDPRLSQFRDFLAAAGLFDELDQPSESGLTLFAPTDDAITALDSVAFDELGDAAELTKVLRHHIVKERLSLSDLAKVEVIQSQHGESLVVVSRDGSTSVGSADISIPDIDAANGVVHVVESVLLPGTLRTEVTLNELVSLDPVLFESGSSAILNRSLATLDGVAQILLDNPFGAVQVQGHTDSDGPAEVNLELSQLRADAVREYLIEQGIESSRITAAGYGETDLRVDPETDDDDKFTNRRIEFRVS